MDDFGTGILVDGSPVDYFGLADGKTKGNVSILTVGRCSHRGTDNVP